MGSTTLEKHSTISFLERIGNLSIFYKLLLLYTAMVAISGFLYETSVIVLFLFQLSGLAVVAYKRLIEGQIVNNKILLYTSFSFMLYFMLQSPTFPVEWYSFELIYFALKFLFIIGALIFFKKTGFCNLFSYLMILAFWVDAAFIHYFMNNGFGKSHTEFYSVAEIMFVLLVCSSLFESKKTMDQAKELASNVTESVEKAKSPLLKLENNPSAMIGVLYVVGHLSNYWAAGFSKVLLDGGPISWLQNDTMANLKRADLWGLFMEHYSEFILNLPFLDVIQYLGNVFVLTIQLLSIVGPLFPILIVPLTIAYDIFHVLVGILAGVWFYKWIFINLLILANAPLICKTVRSFSLQKKLICTFLILFSFYASSVPHLGWYELRQGNLISAYGIHQDGTEEKISNHFWGSGEFHITNNSNRYFERYLVSGQMGTQSIEEARLAENCALPVRENPDFQKHRDELYDFAQRYLYERPAFSKLMILLQPYHLLIPNLNGRSTMFGEPYKAIRFEIKNYCVDENFKLYKEEILDSFVVTTER